MPAFSKLMSVGTLFASSLLTQVAAGGGGGAGGGNYHLSEKWHADTFLKHVKFFHAKDPTNGYVNYLDQEAAEKNGLFKINSDGSLYMGVDHKTTLDPNGKGRDSVRIESKMYYDYGLYVADVAHMPGSICGAWPAFWSVGPKWPENGEVDIIEGVNMGNSNEVVLHTGGSCKMEPQDMSGSLTDVECGLDVSPVGCKVTGANGTSGTPFNQKGGGYYAMERTKQFIKIWYFPRGSEPKSLVDGTPDVKAFGKPMAHMQGDCDFGEHFTGQKLVFNTDFCGDWAGGIFGQDGQCPMSDPDTFTSCKNYVAKNPEEFKEAYWKINSVQIFAPGRGPHADGPPAIGGGPDHHHETHGTAQSATEATTEAPKTTEPATTEAPKTTEAAPKTTESAETTEAPAESTMIPPSTDLPESPSASAEPSSSSSSESSEAPAETTQAAASANHAPAAEASTTRRSTVYKTSTTTICTESETPKAAVMGPQQSNTSDEQEATSTPEQKAPVTTSAPQETTPTPQEKTPATTSAEQETTSTPEQKAPETTDAAVHGDLVTQYSTIAVSSTICPGGCTTSASTPPVGADAVAASSTPTSAVQHAAMVSSSAAVSEDVAAPIVEEPSSTEPTSSSSSTPDASPMHGSAKVLTTVVYPTPAANRDKSSSQLIPSSAAHSPVSSSSLLHGPEQATPSNSPSASGATFTGAAGRLTGVSTGVVGVVAVAVFFA